MCNEAYVRTADCYDSQVAFVSHDQSLQSLYGLKQNSVLNDVPYFHIACGLPSDIMHDLLEGVVCDVIECVLKHFVSTGKISLQFVNLQIEEFPYVGSDKRNKPDVLTEVSKVRQTAAKTRCLLQLLPLMIGYKIPPSEPKWEVLLSLLNIHDLAFAPVLTEGDTFVLDEYVELFLRNFHQEFTTETVKPKMHYLVHYGRQCRTFGPLVQFWSFRFEGKHGYFKELTSRLKCRRNILLTLAKKHQYYQSWRLNCSGPYLHDSNTSECRGQLVMVTSLPGHLLSLIHSVVGESEHIFQATCVTVDGLKYESGLAVVTAVENHEPHLAIITSLFVIDRKLYIVASQLDNQEYCRHFHCYTGKLSSTFTLLTVGQLADPFPVSVYSAHHGVLCVLLKHHICSGDC